MADSLYDSCFLAKNQWVFALETMFAKEAKDPVYLSRKSPRLFFSEVNKGLQYGLSGNRVVLSVT